MGKFDRFHSLMGQAGEARSVFDALGCLRSLWARLALDGVSWAQGYHHRDMKTLLRLVFVQ